VKRFGSLWGALAVAGALALGACGGDDGGTKPPGTDLIFPENFLDTYVLVRDCRFSTEHDGLQIRVYCNPEDAARYTDGNYPFPEGCTLVKIESSDENCTQVVRYSAMRRLADGAASSVGNWEWQRVDADFKAITETPASGCFSCHAGCTHGRDFTCTDP